MVDEREDVGDEAESLSQPAAESTPEQEAASSEAKIEALQEELAQEKKKAEKYLDNWQRAQADFVNYKRRTEQQQNDQTKFASARTIMNILPALDDLERAMLTIPPALAGLTWFEGVALIYRRLQLSLEASGVTEIPTVGQPFDPNLHEAVIHGPGEAGKVIAEFQKGYKLHDRVIRPAMVAVGDGTKPLEGETREQEGRGQEEK